jgi:hypothetical protein
VKLTKEEETKLDVFTISEFFGADILVIELVELLLVVVEGTWVGLLKAGVYLSLVLVKFLIEENSHILAVFQLGFAGDDFLHREVD